jgi:hypothetical protein
MEDTVDNDEYATGWIWTCCKGDGYVEGCIPRPHTGTKFPDVGSALLEKSSKIQDGPDAKHQKMDQSCKKSSNVAIDLGDESEAPKGLQSEGQTPAKAQEVIVLSDSSDAEGYSEEEYDEDDSENLETCTVCDRVYDVDDDEQWFSTHGGKIHYSEHFKMVSLTPK